MNNLTANNQTVKRKRKNSKSSRMKNLLIQELPQCFKHGEHKQPLCIGIHLQVHTHYKDDVRFEPEALQAGLTKYCCGLNYLKTIVEGASRINIHGHPVGIVTAEEAAHAQGKLQKIEEKHQKKALERVQANLKKNTPEPSKSTPKPIL